MDSLRARVEGVHDGSDASHFSASTATGADCTPAWTTRTPKIWETDYTPNATGTAAAYRPQGALERGGRRAAATGDYEAWSPET